MHVVSVLENMRDMRQSDVRRERDFSGLTSTPSARNFAQLRKPDTLAFSQNLYDIF